MSRIIGVTLLLLILVDNFYHSTASHAGFHVTKVHIRKCGCRVFPGGKIICRSSLPPTKSVKKQDLVKCFCSKTNQHKFPEFQAACRSWRPTIPITLL